MMKIASTLDYRQSHVSCLPVQIKKLPLTHTCLHIVQIPVDHLGVTGHFSFSLSWPI